MLHDAAVVAWPAMVERRINQRLTSSLCDDTYELRI